MPYYKLKHKHNLKKIELTTSSGRLMTETGFVDGVEYGLIEYVVPPEVEAALYEYVKPEYRHHFSCSLVFVRMDMMPIHTDRVWATNINFYFDTSDAETIFYKDTEPTGWKSIRCKVFEDHDKMEPIGSFHADPLDVYILDVMTPHTVVFGNFSGRMMYRLHANKSIDEVRSMLTID